MARPSFQAPKGTRDLYPEDMLRRRYITGVWRDTAVRFGFEEIEGPMFESSELYAVKSGEGILGELFQAFSGKSPDEVERVRASGRAPFAMRPEFTPTLARMYAARAAQLPRPTRWFMIGSFFRAERPQRGRLREFLQWNCDVLGSGGLVREEADADLECAETSAAALHAFGLTPAAVSVRLSNRRFIAGVVTQRCGVPEARLDEAFALLDRRGKLPPEVFAEQARAIGFDAAAFDALTRSLPFVGASAARRVDQRRVRVERDAQGQASVDVSGYTGPDILGALSLAIADIDAADRYAFDFSIVRGLAYYTGTVFELIAQGERAVAGGGRYDNLVEMLGGPATPAVGFAMGDVVLGLLLEEAGLMPEGKDLREAISRPGASLRPQAMVVSPDESRDADVRRVVSRLRRGETSPAWLARSNARPWDADRYDCPPVHARRSGKATRNVGKLLADAASQHAVLAVILEPDGSATVKHLDRGEETRGVETDALTAAVRDALATGSPR